MVRRFARLLTAIGLLAGMPVAALAQDTACRNGAFPREPGFIEAVVTAPGRTFFYADINGCPPQGDCRTNSYVIEGDRVIVGRSLGEFVCAYYPSPAGGSAGWVRYEALRVFPVDRNPGLASWEGRWTRENNPEVTITVEDGEAKIMGVAFWPGRPETTEWPSIHIGEIDGRLHIEGPLASYADDNLCELELTLLADFLVISDNRCCGGVNVTFSGVYTRAP